MTNTDTPSFILSSNPETLREALAAFPFTVTVEAEYGEILVEGTLATLAHHGPRAGQPAPCSYPNGFVVDLVQLVGLSHVDLDSLGGCMAIIGVKPPAPDFWRVAEFVDLNGIHRISEANPTPETMEQLHAWYAWSENHRCYPPRDDVADVTDWIEEAADVLTTILVPVPEIPGLPDRDASRAALMAAGADFAAREATLNQDSFVESRGPVLVRVASAFVNHLYASPEGQIGEAVVSLNPRTGAITVSFASPPTGVTAREIVQGLWGLEAGGHVGIAGSPRNRRMTMEALLAAVAATERALSRA
jgi:hypothetical protein